MTTNYDKKKVLGEACFYPKKDFKISVGDSDRREPRIFIFESSISQF